jgi:hypothetical protein
MIFGPAAHQDRRMPKTRAIHFIAGGRAMNRYLGLCLVVLSLALGAQSWAANSIVVESKTVDPGETDVTIGVYVSNSVALNSLIMPLEIRQGTPCSYIADNFDFTVQGRVLASGLMDNALAAYYPTPDPTNWCSGPVSRTYQGGESTPVNFFTSPDALVWWGIRVSGQPLQSGIDVIPSFLLTFDVTSTPGQFEVDTCCRHPSTHLEFTDTGDQPVPVDFTMGTVTISGKPCNNRPEDVNCDGVVDVLDVVKAVNVAFRNFRESPPCCTSGP